MNKEIKTTRFEVEEFEKLKRNLVKYECALAVIMTELLD